MAQLFVRRLQQAGRGFDASRDLMKAVGHCVEILPNGVHAGREVLVDPDDWTSPVDVAKYPTTVILDTPTTWDVDLSRLHALLRQSEEIVDRGDAGLQREARAARQYILRLDLLSVRQRAQLGAFGRTMISRSDLLAIKEVYVSQHRQLPAPSGDVTI